MYQQLSDNKKDSSTLDFILIVGLIIVAFFLRRIIDAVAALPAPYSGIGQGAVIIGIIVLCYLVYTRRVSTFRYSIVYQQPKEGEENIFGKEAPYPWPEGTVLFERMVANKGKLQETVTPDELVALVEPGEKYSSPIGFFNMNSFTGKDKKSAHLLVYRRKGRLWAARIHPDETMVSHIATAIENAANGQSPR